ncbi:tripartite motif-containing protein 16 [Austrofundulus limnaeus]|uniref:Tripartite motif-containing protein 16 n=1 Tax=Austrofundulus limnaeus TaxID=52670 RepID=A0A2I4CTL3_AUSLI|nr:PREDICTED: tripartite motif-containing protein 16-like [Austrofundulus limnaeus]
MEQEAVELNQDSIACSICLDLLKEPTTIPCGHSYCWSCINTYWDEEDRETSHSCPQCGQSFRGRPDLKKNVTLAALVEELRRDGLQGAADLCYAGAEDVSCDVCSDRKLKAVKSCLNCLASYCEKHLQLHFETAAFEKHQLVEPSKKLQENICPRHDEVMKIFCRTDQQCICYLCLMDQHKEHETVSAAAERAEKQKELEQIRQQIQQRIQEREKDVKLLQQEVEAINVSADKTVKENDKMFFGLIKTIKEKRMEAKNRVLGQKKCEVSRVKELQEKLEQEMTELKRKDGQLEQLSHTEDHNQFLHNYPSVSALSESPHSSSIKTRPLRYFEDVTAAVDQLRDNIQDVLRDTWTNISKKVSEVDVLLPEPEPRTRKGFLKYSRELTLDPNTAHAHLLLSEDDTKATYMKEQQTSCSHPDRFTAWHQVLSRETLVGRCYWEVESRRGGVRVAVAYHSMKRAGRLNECLLGCNDRSWALCCDRNSYTFWHNNVKTPVPGFCSRRVGVYLDHRAGVLSFYSVSDTMTLLHRVQTTFTQPLHAGLLFYADGDTAEFVKLK